MDVGPASCGMYICDKTINGGREAYGFSSWLSQGWRGALGSGVLPAGARERDSKVGGAQWPSSGGTLSPRPRREDIGDVWRRFWLSQLRCLPSGDASDLPPSQDGPHNEECSSPRGQSCRGAEPISCPLHPRMESECAVIWVRRPRVHSFIHSFILPPSIHTSVRPSLPPPTLQTAIQCPGGAGNGRCWGPAVSRCPPSWSWCRRRQTIHGGLCPRMAVSAVNTSRAGGCGDKVGEWPVLGRRAVPW